MLLLTLCVVETPCVRLLVPGVSPTDDSDSDGSSNALANAEALDRYFLATIGAMWLAVHAYFGIWAWHAHRRARHALMLTTLADDAGVVRQMRTRPRSQDLHEAAESARPSERSRSASLSCLQHTCPSTSGQGSTALVSTAAEQPVFVPKAVLNARRSIRLSEKATHGNSCMPGRMSAAKTRSKSPTV